MIHRIISLPMLLGVVTALYIAFLLDVMAARWAPNAPHILKNASALLTELGNSGWMAIALIVIAVAANYLRAKSPRFETRTQALLILKLAILLFVIILLSGIAAQVLKLSIGRPRPTLLYSHGAFSLQPLAFNFKLNSFPSGHATTLGAVGAFAAWMMPRHWIAITVTVSILALTRWITHMHYLSDVVAGLAFGALCTALILRAALSAQLIPARVSVRFSNLRTGLRSGLRSLWSMIRTTPR